MGYSPLVADTYQKYKKGTKAFVQWLAATARDTGTVNDLFDTDKTASSNTKAKNKGKANRRTKNHAVNVRDFERFANAIISADKVRIPQWSMVTLRDVIRLRKFCSSFYRAHQEDKKVELSNEGHQYFISILERVYGILVHHAGSTYESRAGVKEDEGVGQHANIFDHLDLEDCGNDGDLPIPTEPFDRKAANDTYELDYDDELQELSVAVYCFMKDLTDIRILVRRTWREYKNRKINLETAALTMNTAIHIFRQLNEAFTEEHPRFEEHQDLINFLFDGYHNPNEDTTSPVSSEWAGYRTPEFTLSSKTFFCDRTCHLITDFLLKGGLPFFRPHPNMLLSSDEEALLRCLSLFGLLNYTSKDMEDRSKVINDQVFEAVVAIRKDRKVTTWAVFAIQTFIDTRRELGVQVSRGLEDMRSTGLWLLDALKDCKQHGEVNNISNWYTIHSDRLDGLITSIEWMRTNYTTQELLEAYFEGSKDRIAMYSWGSFYLWSNHPMVCGMQLFDKMWTYHFMGTTLAGEQGPVMSALHLYNAAQQSGRLSDKFKWADLEYVLRNQDTNWIYAGDPPKTFFESVRRYGRVFGEPASKWAMDKKGNFTSKEAWVENLTGKKTYQGRRQRKRNFIFAHRWVKESQLVEPGIKYIATRARDDPLHMMECLVKAHFKNEKHKSSPSLSPVESLSIFKQTMKEDEFTLRFNLMALNRRCAELFGRIQLICINKAPGYYAPEDVGEDRSIITVCEWLMFGEACPLFRRGTPSCWIDVCVEMAKIIRTQGNHEYIKAEARQAILTGQATDELETFEDPVFELLPYEERHNFDKWTQEELQAVRTRGFIGIGQDLAGELSGKKVVLMEDLDEHHLDNFRCYNRAGPVQEVFRAGGFKK